MSIMSPDGYFIACLQSQGTDIYINTRAPSQQDLENYPHITLCSPRQWNPSTEQFTGTDAFDQEEIESRNVMAVEADINWEQDNVDNYDVLFDIQQMRRSIIFSARVTTADLETRRVDALRREKFCLLYTSPSPRDLSTSRMPSSA